MMNRLIPLLRNVNLFSEMDEGELDAIARIVTVSKVKPTQLIFQEGDPGGKFYLILRGKVKVVHYTPSGREQILSFLGKGDFFGEMALLDDHPRSATVVALEETELAQILHTDFMALLEREPGLTLKLLKELVRRLRLTSNLLVKIGTLDVPHRLCHYLYEYGKLHGRQEDDGSCTVRLPTHQTIADHLSTTRETISRAIGTLRKDGIIKPLDRKGCVRLDMDGLKNLLCSFA